jgi:hypothetical protein
LFLSFTSREQSSNKEIEPSSFLPPKTRTSSQNACRSPFYEAQALSEHLHRQPGRCLLPTRPLPQVAGDDPKNTHLPFPHQPNGTKHQVEPKRLLHLPTTQFQLRQPELIEEHPQEEHPYLQYGQEHPVQRRTNRTLCHPDREHGRLLW